MSDLISRSFDNVRDTARKRGVALPDLSRQGTSAIPRRNRPSLHDRPKAAITVPGLEVPEERRKATVRGIPTGADGRALPRSYKVSSFGNLLGSEIRKRDWTEKMAHGWVMGHWDELVGVKIAQHTRVEMIKGGEVHVSCDSTAWATQMKYMQREVLSAIAAKVGPDAVTKLHVYGPKTKSWRYGPLHVKGRGPRDTYG
ncbi:DciA family protein [Corynebacterium ureicelerivorans]